MGVYSNSLIIASDINFEKFNSIWHNERQTYFLENPDVVSSYQEVVFDGKVSAKFLYGFLKINNSSIILFNPEDAKQALKSKSCLRIIEGAVCSSPDSGDKWLVRFDGEQSFMFKGHLIMNILKEDINWKLEKFQYLIRDGIAIIDLESATERHTTLLSKHAL